MSLCLMYYSCGNVAAIFELDEVLRRDYTIFEAAPNVSQRDDVLAPGTMFPLFCAIK